MKKNKWTDFTKEKKIILINLAELDGWETTTTEYGTAFWKNGHAWPVNEIPDYLDDLNAIHKIEIALDYDSMHEYMYKLGEVIYGSKSNRNDWDYVDMTLATAEQRAKACYLLSLSKFGDKTTEGN